jgi:hypothetical protein
MDDVATEWSASPDDFVVDFDFHVPATEFVALILIYNVVLNNFVRGDKNPYYG